MDHPNNHVNIPKTFNILGITFQEIDPMSSFFASPGPRSETPASSLTLNDSRSTPWEIGGAFCASGDWCSLVQQIRVQCRVPQVAFSPDSHWGIRSADPFIWHRVHRRYKRYKHRGQSSLRVLGKCERRGIGCVRG